MAEHCSNRCMSEVVGTHAADHAIKRGQQSAIIGPAGGLSHRLGIGIEEGMSEESKDPAVQIASVIGGIIFVCVLMFLVFASDQIVHVGWVVIPLTTMGVLLARISARNRE